MKKFIVSLMVAVSALSIVVTDAEAKRMGSGGSIGKQSQSVSRQAQSPMQNQVAPATKPATPAAAPQAAPAKPSSPWKGILGGALLGLGLGALFSHLGIGGALASMLSTILMVGLLAMAGLFIYRMLRRKSGGNAAHANDGLRPAYAASAASAAGSYTPEIGSRLDPASSSQPAALQSASPAVGGAVADETAVHAPWGVPADFDKEGFLRHAKTYFIRLQAAWDKADVNDLREFTTTEMFAELKMQLQERGASLNHTDVMSLEAQLLGLETLDGNYLASVKFSGMIKEEQNAPAEPFAEVWNLSKPVVGQGGWVLAGIQQLS